MRRVAWANFFLASTAAVACAGALAVPASAETPPAAALPRSTVDRPDDLTGPQLHLVYAIPSDGPDNGWDTSGAVGRSAAAIQGWLASQLDGRRLRLDTSNGVADVSFVRLSAAATAVAQPPFGSEPNVFAAPSSIQRQSDKIYHVFYDSPGSGRCSGNVGAGVTMTGGPCATISPDGSTMTNGEFFAARAILITMGYPPDVALVGAASGCMPHRGPGYFFVADSPTDLFYNGPSAYSWSQGTTVIDYGHDDYFGHGDIACPDLARSAFLVGGGTDLPLFMRPEATPTPPTPTPTQTPPAVAARRLPELRPLFAMQVALVTGSHTIGRLVGVRVSRRALPLGTTVTVKCMRGCRRAVSKRIATPGAANLHLTLEPPLRVTGKTRLSISSLAPGYIGRRVIVQFSRNRKRLVPVVVARRCLTSESHRAVRCS